MSDSLVAGYHDRTKHHFQRFAPSLGYLDWSTQPDPFRRYDGVPLVRLAHEPIAAEIVNPDALASDGPPRLNLGCGHIPLDGYVNVDIRALPGVDVVAPVDALPFDPASV